MSSRNLKPWQRNKVRKTGYRAIQRVLILCEDQESSVLYLKRFPVDHDLVEIDCVGTGYNTVSLMEEAIQRKNQAKQAGVTYNEIWVVFDKDSFPKGNFNRAFDVATGHNDIHVCWSNECFELWYLLHFQFQNTAIDRKRIFQKVGKKIGRAYQKNDGSIYDALLEKLPTALDNSKKLFQKNSEDRTPRSNPSTNVHELVRMLLKYTPTG